MKVPKRGGRFKQRLFMRPSLVGIALNCSSFNPISTLLVRGHKRRGCGACNGSDDAFYRQHKCHGRTSFYGMAVLARKALT
jgi:hypothetical protein